MWPAITKMFCFSLPSITLSPPSPDHPALLIPPVTLLQVTGSLLGQSTAIPLSNSLCHHSCSLTGLESSASLPCCLCFTFSAYIHTHPGVSQCSCISAACQEQSCQGLEAGRGHSMPCANTALCKFICQADKSLLKYTSWDFKKKHVYNLATSSGIRVTFPLFCQI